MSNHESENPRTSGRGVGQSAFQVVVEFMSRAGDRLHSINTCKKLGIGIKETVRI